MSRTIVIGDVHGCYKEFEELLEALELDMEDRVIQLGDLVNRGPDSHAVIELAKMYKVEAILGNHELRLLKARRENLPKLLKDYDQKTINQLSESDWEYLERLPKFKYDGVREIICVHGGFLSDQPWVNQSVEIMTSIQVVDKNGLPAKRSDAPSAVPWAELWKGPQFVIYGHTPRPNTVEHPFAIGIDTGCVYGGHLTAYIIEDKSMVQVRARKAYAHSKRLPDPV